MTLIRSAALAALVVLSTIPAAFAHQGVVHEGCPSGQTFTAGDIAVSGAFTRATPKGAQSAGAFVTVVNAGPSADMLAGASSEAAAVTELHSMRMEGDVMKMAPVEGGLEVPAGGSLVLAPMGYHIMLTGMDQQFVEGQCVEITLHFAKAGDLKVQLNVGGFGQKVPPSGDGTGGESSMPMDHPM